MNPYIIREARPDGSIDYVCAPPGWYWTADGVKRESPGYTSNGPEHSNRRERAYKFDTHRAAARVANLCGNAMVVELAEKAGV